MRSYDSDLKQLILDCANQYYRENNQLATGKEIAEIINKPQTTVYRYLKKMNADGDISYTAYGGIRTEYIDKNNTDAVTVAVVGEIACGVPIFAEQNISEYVKLPVSLVGKGEFFILSAKGESMINAGINDGDKVIIRRQNTAEEGQIVVALMDEEATLKRFYKDRKNKRFRLHPENENYDDIYVEDLQIQGVAVGVYKGLM